MFIKPFKVKSNVQLKGSDSKKLRQKIQQNFPQLSETDVNAFVPNKTTVTLIKIITYGNKNCCVYAVEKRPMFFEDEEEKLIPTVYALWLVPHMVPFFSTHPAVLPKLANGADLMIPGVIRQGTGMNAYGHYKKDILVAVNLTSNSAAVGVGRLARSSEDLYMSGGFGPCVKMLHVFGDKLWGVEPTVTLQIPQVSAVLELPKDEDFPELGSNIKSKVKVLHKSIESPVDQNTSEGAIGNIIDNAAFLDINEPEVVLSPELSEAIEPEILNMDTVLINAFLTALKSDGKNLSLPLLTSNFYRLHVLPAAERQIDLKQTSYKKFSKFLHEMADRAFIVVREEGKGVEKITSIDFEHPELVSFIPNNTSTTDRDTENKSQLFHVAMTELYVITDESAAFFSRLNLKKGTGIASGQIKKMLKEYISKNKLLYVNNNSKLISLDPALSEICGGNTQLLFDDIYQTILSKMHHTYEMRGKNELSSNKPPIQMTLATRSGNKKVTLISNLESYGIILSEFAKACKLGAAASTSTVKTPHQKQEQLQVQGNQIRFIYNLLTETYKIPPKQIQGLDLAKKEKKIKK